MPTVMLWGTPENVVSARHLGPGETIEAVLDVSHHDEGHFLVESTPGGAPNQRSGTGVEINVYAGSGPEAARRFETFPVTNFLLPSAKNGEREAKRLRVPTGVYKLTVTNKDRGMAVTVAVTLDLLTRNG